MYGLSYECGTYCGLLWMVRSDKSCHIIMVSHIDLMHWFIALLSCSGGHERNEMDDFIKELPLVILESSA